MRKHILNTALFLLIGLGTLSLFVLAPKPAAAANPATINFQGKIVDNTTGNVGINIPNNTYSIVFRIYNTASPVTTTSCTSTASCLWEETQASVTVTNGVFQVELGSACALTSGSCNNSTGGPIPSNWSNSSLYLTMKFGSDTSFMSPTIHLTSVPFAFNADNLGGIAASNYVQLAQGVQSDGSTTNPSIFINKTGSTANILQLQKSGVNALTVNNSGSVLLGQAGTGGANGTLVFNTINASNTTITIVAASTGSSYSLTLPTTGPGTSQCLQTDSVTASQLKFAACSAGGGDNVLVNSVAATDANFQDVASAAAITGTTWSMSGSGPSNITIAIANATATTAGSVTNGTQSFGGDKTFGGNIIASSSFIQSAISAPSVSSASQGKIYFDSTTKNFQISENGGAYNNLASAITTAITYYVAPAGLAGSTCTYNGVSGTTNGCSPSDSNAGLTKDLPFATIAAARDAIKNKTLYAPVTIQLANTTGGTCFRPNGTTFNNPSSGGTPQSFFDPAQGETDTYPQAYIYILGDTTTPNNVKVSGATSCAGTTSNDLNGIKAVKTTMRIAGVNFTYFGGSASFDDDGGIECLQSVCYIEKSNATSDGKGSLAAGWNSSTIKFGGAFTVTDTQFVDNLGFSTADFHTPAGATTLTFTANSFVNAAIFANESSHVFLDSLTATFSGSASINLIAALAFSSINWNDSYGTGSTNLTFNAANATELYAGQGSHIDEGCGATGVTCTFTAIGKRASADKNSSITYGGTTKGTNPNTVTNGSTIGDAFGAGYSLTGFNTSVLRLQGTSTGYQIQGPGAAPIVNIDTQNTITQVGAFNAANTSFPTTPILDNFDRNNTGPPPSTNWSLGPQDVTAGTGLKISSTKAIKSVGSSTFREDDYWNQTTFGPDSEVYTTVSTVNSADQVEMEVRGNAAGTAGYTLNIDFSSGGGIWCIAPVGGAQLGCFTQAVSNGDSVGLSARGSLIMAWYKPTGSVWAPLFSFVDTTTSTAGYIGIGIAGPTSGTTVLDNFGGGNTTSGFSIDTNGSLTSKNVTDTTTAFQVQNASGGQLFNINSSNSSITLQGLNSGELGAWSTNVANPLPANRAYHSSVVANGYVYVIGGDNSGAQTSVYYAKLNADGSTGAWTLSANGLPAGRLGQTSVVANGYVYVIAGSDGSTYQNTVYYAKLNADGSTGAWNLSANGLPAARLLHASVVANGYVYVIGGLDGGNVFQTTVYYAKLNADGSTGAWTLSANGLPNVRAGGPAVAANGYVYMIGGDGGGTYQNTVYYAKLNADGSTGAWTNQGSNLLPNARDNFSIVVANGYVYVIGGGQVSGNYQSTIYYAKLNADGSTGAWSTSANALPATLRTHSSVIANGYVYVIGGNNGGTYQSTIYYASTARVQIGGSVDLVGLGGQNLADSGDQSSGSLGGSLTAGNTQIVGSLQVQGQGNFAQGISAGGNIVVGGSALFQNSTDSTKGFLVADQVGNPLLNINTTTTKNLLQDGSFEGSSVNNNWVALTGGDTLATDTVDPVFGSQTLKDTTTATANRGIKHNYAFLPNTTYTFSIYVESNTTTGAFFQLVHTENGSVVTTGTGCGGTSAIGASMSRLSCTFTTGSTTVPTDSVQARYTSASNAYTFHFDGAQLEQASAATTYTNPGFSLTNLVGNPSFENGSTNGWAKKGAASTLLNSTDFAESDLKSMKVVATASGDGAAYSLPLQAKTQYSFSLWARTSAANAVTFLLGHQDNGSDSASDCSAFTPGTTWTQYSCTFTTGATVNATTNIYIKTTAAGTPTFYVDGVTFVQAASGLSFVQTANGVEVNNLLNTITLNGGQNADIQPWSLSANVLPQARRFAATATGDGFIYYIGGVTSTPTASRDINYAKLNSDGSTGTWSTITNALPTATYGAAAVVFNSYLYVVGGCQANDTVCGTPANTIYYAPIRPDGTLGNFLTNTQSLPAARGLATAVVTNGYLHVMGGYNASAQGNVYYGRINADGSVYNNTTNSTIGSSGNSLSTSVYGATAVVANNNIYVIGGCTDAGAVCNTASAVVQAAAPANQTGVTGTAPGTWTATNMTALPRATGYHGSALINGYIYVFGGRSSSAAVTTVFYAKVNSDNTIGVWNTSAYYLPAARQSAPVLGNNGYIYVLGGFDGSNPLTSVFQSGTARTVVFGGLDLLALSGLTQSDPNGGGTLNAGDTKIVGNLRVDSLTTLNGGLAVTGPISFFSNPANNAVAFNISSTQSNGSTNNFPLLQVRDLTVNSNQFGGLVLAGGFASQQSYFGEEFNSFRQAKCGLLQAALTDTHTLSRGDWGNAATAVACNTANATNNSGEISTSAVYGASAATNGCTYDNSASNTNGFERTAAVTGNTASSTADCLEVLGGANAAGTNNNIFNGSNFPQVMVKFESSAYGTNQRIFEGISNLATAVANPGTGTKGAYFTNCTAPTTPTCGSTLVGAVQDGANAANTAACPSTDKQGQSLTASKWVYGRIEFRKVPSAGSAEIEFFVDYDTSNGINETSCGTVTNPTASLAASPMSMFNMCVSAAISLTTNCDLDYFRVWQDDSPAPDGAPADQTSNNDTTNGNPNVVQTTAPPISPDSPDPAVAGSFFNFNAASSEDTVFNNNVYVHGTLYADKIKANEIEGLSVFTDELSSLQKKIATSTSSSSNPSSSGNNTVSIQTATLSLNLKDGLVVGGDAEFHGNTFFYKLVTFTEKTLFNNDVTFAAHINTAGNAPNADVGSSGGYTTAPADNPSATLASVNVTGNDNNGRINLTVGDGSSDGELLVVTFNKPYDKTPQVFLTATNNNSAQLRYYVTATASGFKIIAIDLPASGSSYSFNYWVAQ